MKEHSKTRSVMRDIVYYGLWVAIVPGWLAMMWLVLRLCFGRQHNYVVVALSIAAWMIGAGVLTWIHNTKCAERNAALEAELMFQVGDAVNTRTYCLSEYEELMPLDPEDVMRILERIRGDIDFRILPTSVLVSDLILSPQDSERWGDMVAVVMAANEAMVLAIVKIGGSYYQAWWYNDLVTLDDGEVVDWLKA